MKLSEKQEQLLQEIPHNYDFIRHIILMMGESIILVIFSLAILIILHTPLTWYLFVPAFSFLFLGGEWLIHKYLLHRNLFHHFLNFIKNIISYIMMIV